MKIPELIISEEVLPEVRRKLAGSLRNRGWSQSSIASILGTSQAMVSRYLKEDHEIPGPISEMVNVITMDLEAGALSGEDLDDLSIRFCSSVRRCMGSGLLSARFQERFGSRPHMFCFNDRSGPGSRSDVIKDLESALSLLTGQDLHSVTPALKINIAQAIDGAKSVEEVASFPGRMVDREGVIKGAQPPEFGVSKHLAQVLLYAMEGDTSVRSVASIRFSGTVQRMFEPDDMEMIDRDSSSLKRVMIDVSGKRAVADPGDFGVEPCLYLLGTSALEVAMMMIDLQDGVDKKGVGSNEE